MNAGTGRSATLANGTRMRKITVEAAMIAQANQRSRSPAGTSDRTSVRSSAATLDTAKSDIGIRHNRDIATQWQRRRRGTVARDKRFLAYILDDSRYGADRNR